MYAFLNNESYRNLETRIPLFTNNKQKVYYNFLHLTIWQLILYLCRYPMTEYLYEFHYPKRIIRFENKQIFSVIYFCLVLKEFSALMYDIAAKFKLHKDSNFKDIWLMDVMTSFLLCVTCRLPHRNYNKTSHIYFGYKFGLRRNCHSLYFCIINKNLCAFHFHVCSLYNCCRFVSWADVVSANMF